MNEDHSLRARLRRCAVFAAALLLMLPADFPLVSAPTPATPGGPIAVGGPSFGISGTPMTWNPAAMPIQYRVDPGPMSVDPFTGTVVVNNSSGLARVAEG
jgi:hypothetical protein